MYRVDLVISLFIGWGEVVHSLKGERIIMLMRRENTTPIQTIVSERSDLPMVIWSSVVDCDENCPLSGKCLVQHKEEKCCLMKEYYSNIINSAIAVHGSYINEKIMVTIGMNLLPLYGQLFKFKVLEKSLGLNEIVKTNKKGDTIIHPIYKEMRECIKLIDGMWNRVGMKNFKDDKVLSAPEEFLSGDADYYASISAEEHME